MGFISEEIFTTDFVINKVKIRDIKTITIIKNVKFNYRHDIQYNDIQHNDI